MPLARIISTSAKYSDGLADDLRSRGFQVLTSAPGDNISESADLEITLNECLADEARAASDTVETKDMRVFLTPQAFAGNIRSIEMFVLTPKRVSLPEPASEMPVVALASLTSTTLGKMFELAAPVEIVPEEMNRSVGTGCSENIVAAEVEFPSDKFDESVEEITQAVQTTPSDPQSTIGRAILASKQSAWPDMAEMKLVPAELAPAVKSSGMPLQVSTPTERTSAPSSAHTQSLRDKRSWKVPMVAGAAAVLALSTVWLGNHFSASHAQASTTSQQVNTPSIQPVIPATAAAAVIPQPEMVKQSGSPVEHAKPARKTASRPAPIKAHAQRAKSKRHATPESDYVAKDTTVYFSGRPASQPSGQKPQARP
jgi:hypothetical protein